MMAEQQIDNSNISTVYQNLIDQFQKANSVWEFEDLMRSFAKLGDYKDAQYYSKFCNDKRKRIASDKQEIDYGMAMTCFENSKSFRDFERAKKLFEGLGNYKDSTYYVKECEIQMSLRDVNYKMFAPKKETALKVSQNSVRPLEQRQSVSHIKKEETSTENIAFYSRIIRTALIAVLYIPAELLVSLLIIVAASDGSYPSQLAFFTAVFVYNLAKIVYCFISLFPGFKTVEPNIPIVNKIGESKSLFLQVFLRLTFNFVLTNIFYFVAIIICAMIG